MQGWYREDLAHIHDAGFSGYALGSAPGILEILKQSGISGGLVVDLGCEGGLWARELVNAGYGVLGIDTSGAMIELARRRVPEAEFRAGSLFDADIPPCGAVTSVGEVLNYRPDPDDGIQTLTRLFRRVYDVLIPGGVFVFDIAEPGQVAGGTVDRGFTEGEGWVVLVEKEEDAEQETLIRRISTFRRLRKYYRRDDEAHSLRLYESSEVAGELRRTGFQVRMMRGYGHYRLPKAHAAFVAHKPA